MDEFASTMRWSARLTGRFGVGILLTLLATYLLSGIYSIRSSDVGVLLRFGRVVDPAVPSGIHFAFPWPVDRVIEVPVRNVVRLQVDDFYEAGLDAATFRSGTGLSSYLLTGDNNIVTVSCVLQYSIQNPEHYLFVIQNNEQMLKSLACSTLIHSLAGMTIDDILTTGKTSIQLYVKRELQRRLDRMNSGVAVSFVELQDVRPPKRVQASFNDVINARIDRDKMVSTAISYRNECIPKAKADADRMIRNAEGYQEAVIARAEGDAQRFEQQLEEYGRARDVTRRRLHLEMLQEILPDLKGKCLIGKGEDGPLVRLISPGGSD
jgi:membrane protease subunit HflK